tara:strand:- start:192 stop:1439 length:1248 start_codon:yes stop_codon:yes gene_type:complete
MENVKRMYERKNLVVINRTRDTSTDSFLKSISVGAASQFLPELVQQTLPTGKGGTDEYNQRKDIYDYIINGNYIPIFHYADKDKDDLLGYPRDVCSFDYDYDDFMKVGLEGECKFHTIKNDDKIIHDIAILRIGKNNKKVLEYTQAFQIKAKDDLNIFIHNNIHTPFSSFSNYDDINRFFMLLDDPSEYEDKKNEVSKDQIKPLNIYNLDVSKDKDELYQWFVNNEIDLIKIDTLFNDNGEFKDPIWMNLNMKDEDENIFKLSSNNNYIENRIIYSKNKKLNLEDYLNLSSDVQISDVMKNEDSKDAYVHPYYLFCVIMDIDIEDVTMEMTKYEMNKRKMDLENKLDVQEKEYEYYKKELLELDKDIISIDAEKKLIEEILIDSPNNEVIKILNKEWNKDDDTKKYIKIQDENKI